MGSLRGCADCRGRRQSSHVVDRAGVSRPALLACTLHSRQSAGVRVRPQLSPALSDRQPVCGLRSCAIPGLAALCGAAPSSPSRGASGLPALSLSLFIARIIRCCRRSFTVKLACWSPYVTPTTPFAPSLPSAGIAKPALRRIRNLIIASFRAPCHARSEASGAA